MTDTLNLSIYTSQVEDLIDAITSDTSVSDRDLVLVLTGISQRVAASAADLSRPMTHDQRRAMFALFTGIFGGETKPARKVFTRLVLGKPSTDNVSWADHQASTLTFREASKVLDALSALEEAL